MAPAVSMTALDAPAPGLTLRTPPKHCRRASAFLRQVNTPPAQEASMITCIIRYEVDANKTEAFDRYARAWGQIIPSQGLDLIGYFAPHEGSATTAYGIYSVSSLAAYEAYRGRLRKDSRARENFEFARSERFILKEDRIFLRLASAPHAPLVPG
jgi:hypothetical protein